jgi:hypothetical protein
MNNYVYYSYEEYGRGYIGSRGCKFSISEDFKYFGTFSDKTFKPTQKIILGIFETRKEAYNAEILLHKFFEVDVNPHFVNKCKATSSGFTCPKRFSDEEIKQRLKEQKTNASKKWKKNNPEKYKEQKKKFAEKNPDSISAYQKNWNEKNKEKRKEYAKFYYEKNKELLKERSKEQWKNRENKKEYSKNYYKKYKEIGYFNNKNKNNN